MALTLFCSPTALQDFGDVWRTIAPDMDYVLLPAEGRLGDDDIARIDIAVFSHDIWMSGRVGPFFKVLLNAPNVKWLHQFSAGVDNPVFAEVLRRGCRLTHSAGSSAIPIAHTVIMHTISMCRAARPFAIAQSDRKWIDQEVTDVEGRTMGIIGLGSIGSEVARLAQQFGIRVIGMRRNPTGNEPCETWPTSRLHELLPLLDDLVLTAPLTDETRNIIGAEQLALLPRGAHLVNIGRGQLIDEPALIAALQSGHIGAAALDVFVVEPLPTDSPLWDLPNVIVTPHSAGGTALATQRAADMFAENLSHYLRSEPMVNEVT
jgi:phosphoglycerate dehydrogenase-like enzyme